MFEPGEIIISNNNITYLIYIGLNKKFEGGKHVYRRVYTSLSLARLENCRLCPRFLIPGEDFYSVNKELLVND